MHLPAPVPGHVVAAEVEDSSARRWPPRYQAGEPNPVRGPRVGVGLRQHDVTGAEGFDWEYLALLWDVMRAARTDWVTTRPGLPAAHDRAAWRRIGAPAGLGSGFGHREAAKRGVCMFGARLALRPDSRLRELVTEIDDVAALLLELAKQRPRRR